MSNISKRVKELEVLEKYLCEKDLREVAIRVAYDAMKDSLGKENPYAKTNAEYFMREAFLQGINKHLGNDTVFTSEIIEISKKKIKKQISSTQRYQLPRRFDELVEKAIESNEDKIKEKINSIADDFVNSDDYFSAHQRFTDAIGQNVGDLIYSLLEENFKKK